MKTKIYALLILFCPVHFASAQPAIPNAGFEMWDTLTNGTVAPADWNTNNSNYFPSLVQKDTDAHSGSFAPRLRVVEVDTSFVSGLLSCSFAYAPANPITLFVWVKTHLKGNDRVVINPTTLYHNVYGNTLSPVGNTIWYIDSSFNSSTWTQVEISLSFPDTAAGVLSDSSVISFSFSVAKDSGSYFIVDDVSYTDVQVSVNNVNGIISTENMYPNPTDNIENMVYTVAGPSRILLDVYDITGNMVQQVINEFQNTGVYRAEISTTQLASGIYIAALQDNGNTVRQKFIVQH